MERKAAVNYLLEVAERSATFGNVKYSSIVNDLARRVAMSIEDNDINLEKFCSKMAAELLFRDDYANANKLMKLAEDANRPDDNVLPVDNTEDVEQPEEATPSNQEFINKNLPQQQPSDLPPSNPEELNEFLRRLQGLGVTINQDGEENNQPQTEEAQDNLPSGLNQ